MARFGPCQLFSQPAITKDQSMLAVAGDSLEHFLTERYCLYAADGQRRWRAEIHHLPWPLQEAEAEMISNTVAQSQGIELPRRAPALLHFAKRLEVVAWWPRRIS